MRSEVLAAAGAEPYEMTEYQGMADFPWATSSVVDARKLAEALKVVCQRPEVVLLRIISLVDDVESISIKDERPPQDQVRLQRGWRYVTFPHESPGRRER